MRETVLNRDEILDICKRLGQEITNDVKDDKKIPVLIGVMKGALPFMQDLIKEIKTHVYCDYIQICSYSGTQSRGTVELRKDVSFDLTGRTAIIIEDIVDTGLSMAYLINHIKSKNPERVKVCALFDKSIARKNDVKVDYVGKELVKNQFIIGYGLDYNELFRTDPEVTILSPEEKEQIDKMLADRG